MRRRELIAGAGTATMGALAGCTDLLDPTAAGEVTRNEFGALAVTHESGVNERTQGGMTLTYFIVRVTLRNATEEPVSGPVAVRVRFFVGDEEVDADGTTLERVEAGERIEQRLMTLDRPYEVDRYEIAVVPGESAASRTLFTGEGRT